MTPQTEVEHNDTQFKQPHTEFQRILDYSSIELATLDLLLAADRLQRLGRFKLQREGVAPCQNCCCANQTEDKHDA
jgi:hypothetical protein